MKNVVISADGDRKVYSVPDIVADNLAQYCIEFCSKWIWKSSAAKKSVLVKNLGWIDFDAKLPAPYCDYPEFNF